MKLFLKILKTVLFILGITALIFFVVYFIKGIYASCVADDIITQQNRVESSYFFLNMVGFGLISIACLFPTMAIKEKIIEEFEMEKIKDYLNKLIKKVLKK